MEITLKNQTIEFLVKTFKMCWEEIKQEDKRTITKTRCQLIIAGTFMDKS